jgi:hypothetical protein
MALADLWQRVQDLPSLTIIGTTKNAGKTTTLNWLLRMHAQAERRVGLTSVGHDGEVQDSVTGKAKPRIWVVRGTLVATAEAAARRSAPMRLVQALPMRSPMGPIGIYEANQDGEIEIAGPITVQDLRRTIAALQACGIDRMLVDGAIDRRAAATTGVCDGVLLATGTVLAPSAAAVASVTAQRVGLLVLPAAPTDWPAAPGGSAWLDANGTWQAIPYASWLENGVEIAGTLSQAQAITIGGALTDRVLDALLRNPGFPACPILVRDGTCLILSEPVDAAFRRRGGRYFARHPLQLVGVTVNPFNPEEPTDVEPEALKLAVSAALAHQVPVCDVVFEAGG